MLLFEWDEAKAESNLRKHGIAFATAAKAFEDIHLFSEQDRITDGEMRWQGIGMVDGILLLMVAHTIGDEDGWEVIRILSARRATGKEARRYGKNRQENFG